MPNVGLRYVLFISNCLSDNVFGIISAYELKDGRVYALDNLPNQKVNDGADELTFLKNLRSKLPQEEDEIYGPCSPPNRYANTNGAAWGHTATVTVVINSNDFPTKGAQQAIKAAFIAWQNANTHSGVTFTFTSGTSDPNSTNTYYVNRDTASQGASTSISWRSLTNLNSEGMVTAR
jgi:hypothetical protein